MKPVAMLFFLRGERIEARQGLYAKGVKNQRANFRSNHGVAWKEKPTTINISRQQKCSSLLYCMYREVLHKKIETIALSRSKT